MKKFQMKDLGEAKIIIGWEIIRVMEAGMLKINQKRYIQDLLEARKMISYHATVFFIKAGSFIYINQADNDGPANFTIYQRLIEKIIYLAYGIQPNISFVVGLLS